MFESLNDFVEEKSLKEENEKDVALSNKDGICEWEMKLWRIVDEKDLRRSIYNKNKETQH